MPMWQNYPIYIPSYNWDWFSGSLRSTAEFAVDKQRVMLTQPYMVADPYVKLSLHCVSSVPMDLTSVLFSAVSVTIR
jgi:hypothetical protein